MTHCPTQPHSAASSTMNVTCASDATLQAMQGEPEEGLEWGRCKEEGLLLCLVELGVLVAGWALRTGN